METDLKTLIAERGRFKAALTRFKNYFDTYDRTSSSAALKVRLSKVTSIFEGFDVVQTSIETRVEGTDSERTHVNERDEFERSYCDIIGDAEEFIIQRQQFVPASVARDSIPTPTASTSGSEARPRIKLPTIELPTFDGTYNTWIKYKDTFESLIHTNDTLTNIEKFHYLNSSLKGNAARVIRSLGVSEVNYALAWTALKDRFEDRKVLKHHHIRALWELPALTKESFLELRRLLDDTNNGLLALKALGEPTDHWDSIIIYLLTSKLDSTTNREWERKHSLISGEVKLRDMTDFLESDCRYLEKVVTDNPVNPSKKPPNANAGTNRTRVGQVSAYAAASQTSCVLCKKQHLLPQCNEFKKLLPPARISQVQQLRACFNCLNVGHRNKECTRGPCKVCGKKHHVLLRLDQGEKRQSDSANARIPVVSGITAAGEIDETPDVGPVESAVSCFTQLPRSRETVILSTAVIHVKDHRGFKHECRVLLDSGSQSHFITKAMMRKLDLPCTVSNTRVIGIGGSGHGVQHEACVEISSRYNGFRRVISCLVLPRITGNLPGSSLRLGNIQIPSGIKLADPHFDKPSEVDIIIGAGLFWDLQCIGRHSLGSGHPILQKTQLGWVVAGRLSAPLVEAESHIYCNLVTNEQLHQRVEQFWEVESCAYDHGANLSADPCEQHFLKTTTHSKDGRFMVRIPFKENLQDLGDSQEQALKRFLPLERKLDRQPELKKAYTEFMNEYESLGHMSELSSSDLQSSQLVYFLPHHAVFKETSSTTKLRVVFDGSAKTTSGLSINNVQHIGPTVQQDLFSIIVRFRKHKYVLSADVEKMYRQIQVKKEDRRFQRILWRSSASGPVKVYELNTVTYGTASAPFLATRALRQLGETHSGSFPVASRVIIRDFYVDDLLTGTDDLSSAQVLKDELTGILRTVGFTLRKWATNDARVLNHGEDSKAGVEISTDKDLKTLGLFWDAGRDELHYSVNPFSGSRITKRIILSDIAQIFDPLGLIGPVILHAKLLLQQLWQLQISWDESLPLELHTSWSNYRKDLDSINHIAIPRHVFRGCKSTELHGFCDASEKAYGACIYMRSLDGRRQWIVRLLCAKSRVAPLKKISLPRLELCGALLLAQLIKKVRTALDCDFGREFYWTDSMIVISWIKAIPSRWKTFVANRTSEIQRLTSTTWNHVSSSQNPADMISRGLLPSDLVNATLWWNGPAWLLQDSTHWPHTEPCMEEIPEEKQVSHNFVAVEGEDLNIFSTFSTYTRLIRVVGYCIRFIRNVRIRLCREDTASSESVLSRPLPGGFLSTHELANARDILIKMAQQKQFEPEIRNLKNGLDLPRGSALHSLNPFLDSAGLLRVGGRLRRAPIQYQQRHPLILHPQHQFSKLLIEYEHLRLLHAGCQAVVSSLRTRYWLLSAKRAVKGAIRKCVRCFRVRPITVTQVMGDLPAARVTPARAFSACGVDYAGPYLIKDRTRSKTTTKGYLCVFVCFATKAVHLELAIDLSTDAFLNCLKRFVARRGLCQNIYSDNGTNFVGARNELNEFKQLVSDKERNKQISEFLGNREIEWHMIPPRAPHFGGLWESAVKSAKHHLRRVVGETILTYEELYTVLTQVEAVLNSRPLSPLSCDPDDFLPLTPGHFLVGESLTSPPDHDLREIKVNRLNRFQMIQQKVQHFWQRWQNEYLHQLQQRNKWQLTTPSKFGPGALVILKDDNLPPLRWRLGRIEQLHTGQDQITRVVSIRTADGIIKRPMAKVCILPMDQDAEAAQSRTTRPPSLDARHPEATCN